MQKLRTALVSGVVVVGVLGSGGGFYLVQQVSPEAARSLLAVDAGMLVALAVSVWVLLGPTLKRVDDLVEALRALARGEKHTRVDAAEFAGLADVARAINEVAAKQCENDDPNLGPIVKKAREHPTETHKVPKPTRPVVPQEAELPKDLVSEADDDDDDGRVSAHPEIGAVRVRKKPSQPAQPAPVKAEPAVAPAGEPEPKKAPSEPPSGDGVSPFKTAATSSTPERSGDDTVIEPAPEPRLPARPELQSLFSEFVKEKKAANHEDVDVDFDAFAETILAECERLVQEHNCRGVRFEVAVADGEVSLRPRLLR
ncbi:MAG: MXAN_5187 C-terminal domain-containing protein [Deltaproteobacteria bacterium]|nr:MXAN_5187 C-terminal domain-containing protein [Deltaproteobacteria bacterium]